MLVVGVNAGVRGRSRVGVRVRDGIEPRLR